MPKVTRELAALIAALDKQPSMTAIGEALLLSEAAGQPAEPGSRQGASGQ